MKTKEGSRETTANDAVLTETADKRRWQRGPELNSWIATAL